MMDSFVLLTAPAGWGKTYLLLSLYERLGGLFVFVSPLRSLADEFFHLCGQEKIKTQNIFSQDFKSGIVILTAEMLDSDKIDFYKKSGAIFILDEFHLFYEWGDDFRFWLKEIFYEIVASDSRVLALSATIGKLLRDKMEQDFRFASVSFKEILIDDLSLLNNPSHIIRFTDKNDVLRVVRYLLLKKEIRDVIIFCQYKQEVDDWSDFCSRHKLSFLGCVGGQVKIFCEQIKDSHPNVIACTETLSHGVNLPTRRVVVFSYEIKSHQFWIQMAARGGRDGRGFLLFCLNSFQEKRVVRYFSKFLGMFLAWLCYKGTCAQKLRGCYLEKLLFKKDIL